MHVDKFGRNGDKVYTEINIANLTNCFLRRYGRNTAIGVIDMNSNIIKNVATSLSNQDVASKNYADTNGFTTSGGVMSGDITLNVSSGLVRSLGCNNLTTGKKFTLLLGTDTNMLSYAFPDSQLPVPVKIKTDGGFLILINQQPICGFGRDVILCSQPIDMDLHLIKIPVNKFYAVNKAYVDRIKHNTATGIIPNTVATLFTFPIAKWQDNNM